MTKKNYHTQKKSVPSSSNSHSSATNVGSSSRAQKHQTTETSGDDSIIPSSASSSSVNSSSVNSVATTETSATTRIPVSSELSSKLRACYDRLVQLEKKANETTNLAEAQDLLAKAKAARKDIEDLLRPIGVDVNQIKKKRQSQSSSSNSSSNNTSNQYNLLSSTSSSTNTKMPSSPSSSNIIAPVDKNRDNLITKMIESGFNDPTPELLAECQAKGLDLNKKR